MRLAEWIPRVGSATLALCFAAFAGDSLLVLHGHAHKPFLTLNTDGKFRLGLDGLAETIRKRSKPGKTPIVAFACSNDTLEAFDSLPMPGMEPLARRLSGPCDFQGFTDRQPPASPYDLMLFGDGAALPWARLRIGDRNVVTPISSLPLRLVSPPSLHIKEPAVLRAPFLRPILGKPMGHDTSGASFRLVEGTLRRESVKADSVTGWNWSVVANPSNTLLRVDSRNLPKGQSIWLYSLGKNQARLLFDDAYRREPRKVAAIRSASGKPYLTMEIATLYGDGVWTDLWIVGSDTAWTKRIGVVDGESGETWQGTWKLDRKRGKITVRIPEKIRDHFIAP